MNRNKLALIGMMGTLKTSVATVLAGRLGLVLHDTDQIIEQKTGQSIRQIFAEHGQAHFRQLESQLIAALAPLDGQCLALGGGAVIDPANMRALADFCIIRLTASDEEIYRRLRDDTTRPLLGQRVTLQDIVSIRSSREHLYSGYAQLTVDTDGRTTDQIASQIIDWLAKNK